MAGKRANRRTRNRIEEKRRQVSRRGDTVIWCGGGDGGDGGDGGGG